MLFKTSLYSYLIIFFITVLLSSNHTVMADDKRPESSSQLTKSAQSSQFMQENQLESAFSAEIKEFWQKGDFSHFNAIDKVRINYAQFIHNKEVNSCIVIISGRSESYLKYQELSYDLFQQGYDIFLLDHRGQGLSERLLANPNKGYVADFTDYENDLSYFIDNIVNQTCKNKPYILAHSMGSVIATRYMQQFPDKIQAAALSSPMIGFSSGPIPTFIAKGLIAFINTLNHWLSSEPWYFVGQSDYRAIDFNDNVLSHSKIRYQQVVNLYKSTSEIQLGGVTVHWLDEGIKAQHKIFEQLDKLTTPIQVLQASEDTVIDNQAQNDFCQQLHQVQPRSCPTGQPVIIEGAYHELFIESDKMREQTLNEILSWFKRHPH